jgi:hypothetical protein
VLRRSTSSLQLANAFEKCGRRAESAEHSSEPLGARLETGEAGTFLLVVPPGRYQVVIQAPVARDGVVILNADLLRGKP